MSNLMAKFWRDEDAGFGMPGQPDPADKSQWQRYFILMALHGNFPKIPKQNLFTAGILGLKKR
jgi:hypothetical protein